MDIIISQPTYIYQDHMSIIHNTSKPESTLKMKYNAIAFHAVHKSVVVREKLTGHISSEDYPADLVTKVAEDKASCVKSII